MNIRDRIRDAMDLFEAGRYESALTLALIAAAGTSRRRYPAANGYSSDTALSNFLHEERLVLSGGAVLNHNVKYAHAKDKKYINGLVPWHELLAIFLRNQLLHQAEMPPDIRIVEYDNQTIAIGIDGSIEFSQHFILGLVRSVEIAAENRSEWPEIAQMSDAQLAEILFSHPAPLGHGLEYMQQKLGRFLNPPTAGGPSVP